ncbi:hypothetical protein DUHN55_23840 [Helicobacter pylori]
MPSMSGVAWTASRSASDAGTVVSGSVMNLSISVDDASRAVDGTGRSEVSQAVRRHEGPTATDVSSGEKDADRAPLVVVMLPATPSRSRNEAGAPLGCDA